MVYFLSLLSGLLHGFSGLVNKKVSNLVDNPILSSLLFNIFSTLVSLLFVFEDILNQNIVISHHIFDWMLILLSGVITTFAFSGMYASLRNLPASEQILLSRASVLTYTIGGILVLGESVTGYKLLGIVLILSGVIISSIRKGKFVVNQWTFVQLLSSVGFGVSVLIDKTISYNFSSGIYIFINVVTTTIGLFILAYYQKVFAKVSEVSKKYYFFTFISALMTVIAYYFVIKSYSLGGDVVIVGSLTQIKLPIVVIGGYYIYKEKNDLLQKIIGIVTVIAGVVLLKF